MKRLTPEREKEIKEMISPGRTYDCEESETVPELLAELDALREELAITVEALDEISSNYHEGSASLHIAKLALEEIRGEK